MSPDILRSSTPAADFPRTAAPRSGPDPHRPGRFCVALYRLTGGGRPLSDWLMGAGHNHAGHDHGGGGNFGRAFIIGIILNLTFVVIETIYGFAANSMALLADAGHNLSDVLGLVVAYVGALLVKRRPSPRFS